MTLTKIVSRLLAVSWLWLTLPVFGGENLLRNPGLEEGTGDSVTAWELWSYDPEIPSRVERSREDVHEGEWCAVLINAAPDDCRLVQTVIVEPNSLYRLAGWLKAEGVEDQGMGVNLSLRNHYVNSARISGFSEEWQYVEVFLATDDYSTELLVCLALGGFASPNSGRAYFDQVSLEKVSAATGGAFVYQLNSPRPGENQGLTEQQDRSGKGQNLRFLFAGRQLSPLAWTLCALSLIWAFLIISYIVTRKYGKTGWLGKWLADGYAALKSGEQGWKGILFSPPVKLVFITLLVFIFLLDLCSTYQGDPLKNFENHYVFQAAAFLKGRLSIDRYTFDMAVVDGRNYVIYPPFPVLILLPFVAVFGLKTKVSVISTFLTLINLFLLGRVLKKLKVAKNLWPWVLLAFIFGTGYWFCLTRTGQVYFFAHLCAVFACLLCLNEVLGKGRGLLAGIFLGMAFLSRQLTIFYFFFVMIALWNRKEERSLKSEWCNLLLFCCSLGVCVLVYLGYNYLRFGSFFDTGYSYLKVADFLQQRVDAHGIFSPAYITHNFLFLFFQGFAFEFDGMKVSNFSSFGTSLTFASPFFFFAFFSRWKKSFKIGAWVSIVLIICVQLLYYNNGWIQYNTQRFTLDFIPLLLVLTATGMQHIPAKIRKTLILYSVVMNAFSTWLLLSPQALTLFL